MVLGGNICSVFPGRCLLFREAAIRWGRGVRREKRQPTCPALVMALEELVALDRGNRSFTGRLINFTQDDERGGEP